MWIEIFKTGTHTDSSGAKEDYTAKSLDEIAGIYNKQVAGSESFSAPIVKGHPNTDSPAFGWVEKLARRGNKLLARIKDISPDLIKEVKSGMFKKVSIALYPDKMLRHLGFLGGAAPAVKGLKNLKFSSEEKFIEIETKSALDSAENSDSEDGISNQENKNHQEFNEKISALEAENEKFLEEKNDYKAELKKIRSEKRDKGFREFVNSLISSDKGALISPAMSGTVIKILEMAERCDRSSKANLEFSESGSNLKTAKEFFSNLKPQVSKGEFASFHNCASKDSLDLFEGVNVNPERMDLHEKAMEMKNLHPEISYQEAIYKSQQ